MTGFSLSKGPLSCCVGVSQRGQDWRLRSRCREGQEGGEVGLGSGRGRGGGEKWVDLRDRRRSVMAGGAAGNNANF